MFVLDELTEGDDAHSSEEDYKHTPEEEDDEEEFIHVRLHLA